MPVCGECKQRFRAKMRCSICKQPFVHDCTRNSALCTACEINRRQGDVVFD